MYRMQSLKRPTLQEIPAFKGSVSRETASWTCIVYPNVQATLPISQRLSGLAILGYRFEECTLHSTPVRAIKLDKVHRESCHSTASTKPIQAGGNEACVCFCSNAFPFAAAILNTTGEGIRLNPVTTTEQQGSHQLQCL